MSGTGTAHHGLEDAQQLATKNMSLSRTKAMDPLVSHCGTLKAAREFARDGIAGLTESAFAETVEMFLGQKFDVYGLRKDGVLWFVKFAIDIDNQGEELLNVVSFHPSDRAIVTNGGELPL